MYKSPVEEGVWPWGTEGTLVLPSQQQRGKEAQETRKGKRADQVCFGSMTVTIPQGSEGPLMGFKEEHRGIINILEKRLWLFGGRELEGD